MILSLRPIKQDEYAVWREMTKDYDALISEERALVAWQRFHTVALEIGAAFIVKNGEIVGFVHFHRHQFVFQLNETWYLSDLYVKPEHRRNGIARIVIGALTDFLKSDGAERLYWVTEVDNPIRTFYDTIAIPGFIRYHIDF